MQTVFVIEDDTAIRRGVVDTLRFSGYTVFEAGDGREALARLAELHFDLVLLDLVLPGCSGFDLLRALQTQHPGVPVIILSALGEEADRVQGLKLGADDYVTKPFSVAELLARIQAVLRRSPERTKHQGCLCFPGGEIDLGAQVIRYADGSGVPLSEKETQLLKYMSQHPGRTLSREELLQRLWGVAGRLTETRTVDVHVANLRAKLRDLTQPAQVLVTVRSKGYALHLPKAPAST